MRLVLICCCILIPGCRSSKLPSLQEIYRSANEQLQIGEISTSAELGRKGYEHALKNRDPQWLPAFQVLHAQLLVSERKFQEALRTLEFISGNGTPEVQVRSIMTRGYAECSLANTEAEYQRAIETLNVSRVFADDLERRDLAAEAEGRIGLCLTLQRSYQQAEERLLHALQQARDQHLSYLQAQMLGNLSFMFLRKGNCDESIEWGRQALELSQQIGAKTFVAKSSLNLGVCYYRLGDYDSALALLKRAETLAGEPERTSDYQLLLQNMGNLVFRRGDLNSAQAYFKRSLELVSKDDVGRKAQLLANLAACAIGRGAYVEAGQYNQEALELKRALKDGGAEQYSNLISANIAAHQNQPLKAETLYRNVFNSQESDIEIQWEAHAGLARVLAASGKKVRAEDEFRRAIELVEKTSDGLKRPEHKLTLFSSLINFYDDYVSFLIETGKPRDSLEVAERSRARILLEKLEGKTTPAHVSASHLVQLAAALHSTLISYWLSPVKSYVWVIDSRGVQLRQLPSEAEIGANVTAYSANIQNSVDPLADRVLEGAALYRMLVEPVADLIPSGAQVIIVPDGSLHQLNFESLIAPNPAPHYWIEDVSIVMTPSLGHLTVAGANQGRPSLLLIGNPKSPDARFPDLPNAATEVEQLSNQFPVAQRAVYSGENANPETYPGAIPNRFGFIHFAAHATANTESPLDSAVILSRKNGSYRLHARDVVTTPISAELVSISACRGAGAKAFAGEGLVGFAWAFLSAGAHNVIAGLWDVEDGSSSRMMIQLYREINQGRTPQQALRSAKLTVLHSGGAFAKPYYWAPFVAYTRQPAPIRRR